MQAADCLKFCQEAWSEGGFAVEGLKEMVRVPNLSPAYDEGFHTNGLINKVIDTVLDWVKKLELKGLSYKVFNEKGREPLVMIKIEPTNEKSKHVLTYGHLDKMPHCDPATWDEGLSATNPVIRGDKIYGRGTNDDGYNPYCILTCIKYLQTKGLPHPKMTMLLETGEESGDEEITRYLHELRSDIGDVDVILVPDAEAEDYNTFWTCASLRGVVVGVLSVEHLTAPCHSGMGTGIVPETFRIVRQLLSRIEDEKTGDILLKEAHNPSIPEFRVKECEDVARQLGMQAVAIATPVEGADYLSKDVAKMVVDRAWKPGLAVTGADGIPAVADGSNVIRTRTALKLSLRIPPGVDPEEVSAALKRELERDPPYNARVAFTPMAAGAGWAAKAFSPEVAATLERSVVAVFGQKPLFYGDGGSIPLCNLLQALWPECSLIVTGAAGVDSAPHGPNESLNLPYTAKFTAALTGFLEGICH